MARVAHQVKLLVSETETVAKSFCLTGVTTVEGQLLTVSRGVAACEVMVFEIIHGSQNVLVGAQFYLVGEMKFMMYREVRKE